MLSLGFLSFTAPWVLIGFVALPLIWWILRLRPPAPARVVFPPMVLLRRLMRRQESPGRVPPWLLVLRFLVAAMIISALAHPLINAETQLVGPGPLYLIVDDDWASAGRWQMRRAAMINFVDQAAREDRSVVLILTAVPPNTGKHEMIKLMSPTDARKIVEGVVPKPWHTDRLKAVELLLEWSGKTNHQLGDVVWLSNSVDYSAPKTKASIKVLIQRLERLGSVIIMVDKAGRFPILLRPPDAEGKALILHVDRPTASTASFPARGLVVRALDDKGQILAHLPVVLQRGAQRVQAKLHLPSELRNRLARLEVSGIDSAGTVVLVDERWRRRPVALVKADSNIDQPLLDAQHYLRQALDPFTEVRTGDIAELLGRPLSVMIIADSETPVQGEVALLKAWLDKGGVLVRFAGPNLARDAGMADALLPVQLRRGNRVVGGSLSWGKPEILAPFPKTSPFHGLAVPKDVYVRRQVLAEPSLDLASKTWAQLSDGTPLVTAVRRGEGWLVLVHTTADGTWADLSFSGVFVEMLRRLINVSRGVIVSGSNNLVPVASLDAFGKLGNPPRGIFAITASDLNAGKVGPSNPPGLYGHKRSLRALNLSQGLTRFGAIGQFRKSVQRSEYLDAAALDLKPWLLVFGAVLFLVDIAISFYMRGLFQVQSLVIVLAVVLTSAAAAAYAKDKEAYALANSLETRMAYVLTGSRQIDEISHAGLVGLNHILWRRTAAELGTPQGVDPTVDELAFFPLLYWPIIAGARIEDEAARHVRAYLRNGGTILFDTRGAPSNRRGDFGVLARQLALPPLLPIDADHVLGRTFYLLREFPGRWTGDILWIEKAGERTNDGVSRVIVGNHDWASAWAMDTAQRPLFAVVPGGERQREMAFRFGINLVMYTLTGNYKADQVHLPAIIRRLGQ